jgi:type VI secretion system protein ImpL
MLNEMGGPVKDTFVITPAVQQALIIPALYTKVVYDQIDFSKGSELLVNMSKEKWLLYDESENNINFAKDDLNSVSKKVKALYLADYSKQWQQIYNAMNVKSTSSIMQTNNALSSFADPIYSPIVAILNVTVANTELSSQAAANLADDNDSGITGKAASLVASKVQWTSVDKKYRDINVLLRESNKQPPAINTALSKIAQVQEMVNSISLAPDPNQKAFQIVQARYQSGADNAITALNAYAKNTPAPVKRWLTKISAESWNVVVKTASQHLNNEWRTSVYQPYLDSIAGRYPVSSSSANDIALIDFVEFFKPGGNMDAFYTNNIKPFITTRGGWRNKSVDGHSLGLSSRTLRQIKQAIEIKNVFFRQDPETPSLTFNLKPNVMPKNNIRFMLDVGDNRLSYSHGPKFWKTLKWVADGEQNRVRIIFEDLDEQQHSKTFSGPWAWFRLLSQSKLTKTSDSSTYIVNFALDDGSEDTRKISYRIKAQSVNNPFEKKLLGTFRCPERL